MSEMLSVRFDSALLVVGLVCLRAGDAALGRTAAVVKWQDGFALLAGEYFLCAPHERYGDDSWCFASNVGTGPDGWNEVRKFESVDCALRYLSAEGLLRS